ncbi:hypothetical protein E4T43_02317 [Aureobasidium subglaciale]|nr:hypothetical protein E4T43_02317 [Aureobasidium subglaciale]
MASATLGEWGSGKKRRRKRGSTAGPWPGSSGWRRKTVLPHCCFPCPSPLTPAETLSSADPHHGPIFHTKPDNLELLPSSLCDLQLHLPLAPPLTMSCRPSIYQAPSLCASQSTRPHA